MSNSQFNVDHIRVVTSKPFDKVKTDFERQIGRIDPEIYKSLQAGDDGEAIRRRIEAMAGPSGFMLFATHDHGRAADPGSGSSRKAIQYILGNPLFAIEMTRHAIGASLYVPLRAGCFMKTIKVRLASNTIGRRRSSGNSAMIESRRLLCRWTGSWRI